MKKIIMAMCIAALLCCSIFMFTGCSAFGKSNGGNTTESSQSKEKGDNEQVHTHVYGEWVVEVESTCQQTGKRTKTCECGDKQSETIPKKSEHTGDWVDVTPSTCRIAGTQKRICSVCNTVETRVSTKEHTYSDNVCTECGFTANGTTGITYSGANVTGCGSGVSGDVVIPEKYNNKSVTKINSNAFKDNTKITSITIPSTITSIGDNAFSGCTNLKTVYYNAANATVPSSNYSCTVFLNAGDNVDGGLTIIIGSTVKTIPEDLFYPSGDAETRGLAVKDIIFSADTELETIERGAFAGCRGFKQLVFPASLKTIKFHAFYYCTTLEKIEFAYGSNFEALESAFQMNTSLVSAVIPASTTDVALSAFAGSTALQTVTFENTSGWMCQQYSQSTEYDVSSPSLNAGRMRGAQATSAQLWNKKKFNMTAL